MARYVQAGKVINYFNNSEEPISCGDEIILNDRLGIAAVDIPVGAVGAVELEGVYEFKAETSTEFEVGDKVYWNSANKFVSAAKPDTGAVLVGMVVEPKPKTSDIALVKI